MKKVIIALGAIALLPSLALAQGTVNFGTTSSGVQYITLADGTTRAPAGTEAQLWWSPDNVAPYQQIAVNNVTINGWLTSGVVVDTPNETAPGADAWFFILATDGVQFFGTTPNFQNATGNTVKVPPDLAANLTGWDAPISMSQVVPEPTTFALAGLGAAALLIFRRRD
jgi:hypothetical protein